jgi:hypothetical protein
MMPLTQPIQWNDISIDERDLTNLEHKITRCLTGDEPYVWLFASPETVGTTGADCQSHYGRPTERARCGDVGVVEGAPSHASSDVDLPPLGENSSDDDSD